jgi:hypothetical protein
MKTIINEIHREKYIKLEGRVARVQRNNIITINLYTWWLPDIKVREIIFRKSVYIFASITKLKTPWPYSASEVYRPSDSRLSAKFRFCMILVLTYERGGSKSLAL